MYIANHIVYSYIITGRYKQWNGLLEWNTGLDYWTELFSFLDKFLCLFLEA